MQDDRRSPSRTLKEIEAPANQYRQLPGVVGEDGRIDIHNLLTALRVDLVVKTEKQMGTERAYADSVNRQIVCGREHAKGLRFGLPNVRYDFLHEVGHIAIHPSAELKALKRLGNLSHRSFIRDDESEERQAWKFARAIAVPRSFLGEPDDSKLALVVGIPAYAVALRRDEVELDVRSELPKATPIEVHQFLLKGRLGERSYQYVLTAWERAATLDGKDPRAFRVVANFLIEFMHYGNASAHTGWTVVNGEARPLMAR